MTGLFESDRLRLKEAIEQTEASLLAYADRYEHWAVAYSGGKDSSALVTVTAHLIETGRVPKPKSLTVLYADTRMEMPPLQIAAIGVLAELRDRDIDTQVVLPALDDRFYVYMLGRGVPPPNNKTLRWCTSQIKIEPMHRALAELRERAGQKLLMLTGVRLGESASRDARIALSCSRDNAECGQGWLQIHTPTAIADTLAPILHWRVCNVWAWLTAHAPDLGFPTLPIATAYGGDEKEEINARTGCVGCPLASRDVALDAVVKSPEWRYLAPLKGLRPLYDELRFTRRFRLRKAGVETLKSGGISANPQRIGPLTMEARRYGLERILAIQEEVNQAARQAGKPLIDLISREEETRILELIDANTWPNKWTGEEPTADEPLDRVFGDGTEQPLLEMFVDSDSMEEVA
jgi:DNA sulfur modification protein DndC